MTVQAADPAAAPHDGTVSLRELLSEPELHVDTLTPDGDLGRAIRYVYPTELADPSPYLAGEELILSVGVPLAGQTADAIRHYVRTLTDRGVARFKVPEQIHVVGALPKNDAGKVLKHVLKAELTKES